MYSDSESRSTGLARVDAAISGVVNSRKSTSFYLRSEPRTAKTFLARSIRMVTIVVDLLFIVC